MSTISRSCACQNYHEGSHRDTGSQNSPAVYYIIVIRVDTCLLHLASNKGCHNTVRDVEYGLRSGWANYGGIGRLVHQNPSICKAHMRTCTCVGTNAKAGRIKGYSFLVYSSPQYNSEEKRMKTNSLLESQPGLHTDHRVNSSSTFLLQTHGAKPKNNTSNGNGLRGASTTATTNTTYRTAS